jgi:hypothetical protein
MPFDRRHARLWPLVVGHVGAAGEKPGHLEAEAAARHVLLGHQHEPKDLGDREREQREVGSAQAQHQRAHQRAEHHREDHDERDRERERQAEPQRQQRGA